MCGAAKRKQNSRSKLRIRAAATLLSVMLVLPAIPMSVHAKEDVYEVQKGDCLWKIAERYLGDGARYTDIVAWNEELIQDPNLIYPGMTLRIMADAETDSNPDAETDSNSDTETDMQDPLMETLEEMSIFGTISGSSWENEWLGMRFDLPEGFKLGTAEEFLGDDEYEFDSEDDSIMVDLEFVVESTDILGPIAYFAITLWDDSIEAFMEEIKAEELDAGMKMDLEWEWSTEETAEFGGRTFEHFTSSSKLLDIDIYEDYYVAKQDDIVFFFSIIYPIYPDVDSVGSEPTVLLDGFSAYSDKTP